jgi:hypothetical protein
MKFTKILAATLLAGSLAVGTVGIASAATTPGTAPSKPSEEQLCHRAQTVWQRLKNLDERARTHQEKLTALRDKAATEGNADLVAKIDARLAHLQERHDKIVARLQELHDKALRSEGHSGQGQGRCDPAGTVPADPGSEPTDPATVAPSNAATS